MRGEAAAVGRWMVAGRDEGGDGVRMRMKMRRMMRMMRRMMMKMRMRRMPGRSRGEEAAHC